MGSRYSELDFSGIHTYPIRDRSSKVELDNLAGPVIPGGSFETFFDNLPDTLAAADLRTLVSRIVAAKRRGKPVLIMMGAHVIKVGLSPVIIQLMEAGVVQAVALNGAGAIHDMELAYFGKTSEDVGEALEHGRFGMVRETADLVNGAAEQAALAGLGFGEAAGKRIREDSPPHEKNSILGQAYRLAVPVTVHVALGTDIVHQHPSADGAAIGDASLRDFRIFSSSVSRIGDGGVVLLFGSSVILPEVFLKALTVARNLGGPVKDFTTASFDMIRHYRPRVNVLERPNQPGGKGIGIVGHHEIMIPLLASAVLGALNRKPEKRKK